MSQLCYCKKCGRVVREIDFEEGKAKCDICGSIVYAVPEKYNDTGVIIKLELEEEFIEKYIKSSPEFDQDLFDRRDSIMWERDMEWLEQRARMKEGGPRCPYCGSSNIGRIGGVSRAISVGMFGMASGKIGKTHKCRSCGGMW